MRQHEEGSQSGKKSLESKINTWEGCGRGGGPKKSKRHGRAAVAAEARRRVKGMVWA
jgi:hypothetical protein